MFLKHVQMVILELNKLRTLQGLLEDYKTILHIFGFHICGTKNIVISE